MDWLYDLVQPFVWHAWRAFGVAFAFLLLYGVARLVRPNRPRSSPKPMLIATIAWTVFALMEAEATRERANIRVDLLVTWPLLCLVSLGAVALWLGSLLRPSGEPLPGTPADG
ncbi:hypothetical protein [Longimicrobium sp.]|jgi:hypothetical protein|uniref:hypothetical protein n=1 Tax=Longimicrobium sp. TaxID=2029185 RepID=UPI002ED787C9